MCAVVVTDATARKRSMRATLLLADYAVVANNKLTIVGGGWKTTGPEGDGAR